MRIDRIHFYLDDAARWREWFVDRWGFTAVAGDGNEEHTQMEIVRSREVTFVLSSPRTPESPVAEFLRQRSPGVAEIAFVVPDLDAAIERAIASGTEMRQPPRQIVSPRGGLRWVQIESHMPIAHTLVERRGVTPIVPSGEAIAGSEDGKWISDIDHVVLNVAAGELEATVAWYERAFGFERQQHFAIATSRSGLYSQVLVHPESGVRLPVNEPTTANSQIQEFLDANGGAGIQHVALSTPNLPRATPELQRAGVAFLHVPGSYYEQLRATAIGLPLSERDWEAIVSSGILIDWGVAGADTDELPLLLQIFTQPIFPQPTFFFELIERRNRVQGFGERNFRALFEAIERQQLQRGRDR